MEPIMDDGEPSVELMHNEAIADTISEDDDDLSSVGDESSQGNCESESDNDSIGEEEHIQVGMFFSNNDEIYSLYKRHAWSKGFGVKKMSGNKDRNGDFQFVTYACHRAQKPSVRSRSGERQRPSTRINCRSRVCASRQRDGRWRINTVELQHNHEMVPNKARYLPHHKVLPPNLKLKLEINDRAGIKPSKTYGAFVIGSGGHEYVCCLERDCRNYLGKVRQLQVSKGDVEAVLQMFKRMREKDKNFYFEISLDEERRLHNLVWVDSRCQAAYKEFGDVISFDTTYLVNKYEMPFAPFVGVNHHGHSILLGCALICDEKASTFEWVFKHWLEAMGGVLPQGIVTDQCASIAKAIEIVFPGVRHRLCLWHIMSKVHKKVKQGEIKLAFNKLIYNSVETEEFENGWASLIQNYNYSLKGKKWLLEMYKLKEKWVPVYVNQYFWAAMQSTQRSESMNSFFDGYIHSRSSLKQFVDQYERAVIDKIEKENKADFDSKNSYIPLFSEYAFEKPFQESYTHGMYSLVRKQFKNMMYCGVLNSNYIEQIGTYKIEFRTHTDGDLELLAYNVSFDNNTSEVKCNCKMFESCGILCAHSLFVLAQKHVQVLPSAYIQRRWQKDVIRCHSDMRVGLFTPMSIKYSSRLKQLEETCAIATHMAYKDTEMFGYADKSFKSIVKNLQNWGCVPSEENLREQENEGVNDSVIEEGQEVIRDPKTSKPRGRPKTKRIQSCFEKGANRKPNKRQRKKSSKDDLNENVLHDPSNESNRSSRGVEQEAVNAESENFSGNVFVAENQNIRIHMQEAGAEQVASSSMLALLRSMDLLAANQGMHS